MNKKNTNEKQHFPFTKLLDEGIQGTQQICKETKTKKNIKSKCLRLKVDH